MKLLHYIVLNQSTPLFMQTVELICIAKRKRRKRKRRGGKVFEKMDFLSVPSCCVVHAYRSWQPLLRLHTGRNFEYLQKKTSFYSNFMVYFQRPSLLSPDVNKLGAGDSLPEYHKWKELLYIQMQVTSPAERFRFHFTGTNSAAKER